MQRENIDEQLASMSFEFFYSFSRFEFALKEVGYLKNAAPGALAEPDWSRYVADWAGQYTMSGQAAELVAAAPERQVNSAAACQQVTSS